MRKGSCLPYDLGMKRVSDARAKEIAEFSAILRDTAMGFVAESDAERIRIMAELLEAGEPAVKKWWYGQNAPRGGAARAILRQLEAINLQGALPEGCEECLPDHPD